MVSTESAKLAYSLHCGRRKELWTWVARDLPSGGIGGMGGRGLLSGQQTLGGLGDGVCQGPGDRAVSLPAPCSVTTLAQKEGLSRHQAQYCAWTPLAP